MLGEKEGKGRDGQVSGKFNLFHKLPGSPPDLIPKSYTGRFTKCRFIRHPRLRFRHGLSFLLMSVVAHGLVGESVRAHARRKKKGKERLRENARLYIELIIRDNGLNGEGKEKKRYDDTLPRILSYVERYVEGAEEGLRKKWKKRKDGQMPPPPRDG